MGVLPTSDPVKKIRDAYALMGRGRALRANQFASEALSVFESQNDLDGMARAHSVLGDINRDGHARDLPNYPEAKAQFTKAAEFYQKLNRPKWQAFNVYAVAGIQSNEGNSSEARDSLAQSKNIYSQSPDATLLPESFEKGGAFSFSSFPDLEKSFNCRNKARQ